MSSHSGISVIIPCHNDGEFLGEALDSIAAQRTPAREVIIVNDGSTDDSLKVVEGYRDRLPVKVKTVSFGNAAATRNAGIEMAAGEWLAFLDADNRWYPDHLEQAMKMLSGSGDAAYMAYPGPEQSEHGAAGADTLHSTPLQAPASGLTHRDFIHLRLKGSFGFPTTGQVLRTEVVQRLGGFDVTQIRRHDFELFMRTIHERTWSFNTSRTWHSRPPRPGNISSNDVECRYFALRALLLNQQRYAGETMNRVISMAARKAVTAAMLAGTTDQRRRSWTAARPHLQFKDMLLLSASLARHAGKALGRARQS